MPPLTEDSRAVRSGLAAIAFAMVLAFVLFPITGWVAVTRVSVVLLAGALLALAVVRPWRWRPSALATLAEWSPSSRMVWTAASLIGLVLFWFVLTRFRSGEINAVDFTVHYDRPTFQTLHGRPMFIESSDEASRAHTTSFALHAHWAMLPLSALYAIHATPLWLLALSVLAVVAGAVHVLRILQRLGAGGLVASASTLAFVLNDNTARTLNYGFHVEVLYAWLIPWLIDAALTGRRLLFLALVLACVAVKEDAVLFLAATSIALALVRFRSLTRSDRILYLALPPLVALVNLSVYYGYVVPLLRPDGAPFYANYWGSYGATPARALGGMLMDPWRVLSRAVTSSFLTRVMVPHVFLSLVGWRWTIGILPIVLLYGASDNEQLRSFGIYYAIVLVPFLVIGAGIGALAVARRLWRDPHRAAVAAATVLVTGALAGGLTDAGYSLRPWKPEIAAVPDAIVQLSSEPVVLVQSGLYRHAGYESRVQLLSAYTLNDPRNGGAALLLAPGISAWPFGRADVESWIELPSLGPMPGGLVAVRLTRR